MLEYCRKKLNKLEGLGRLRDFRPLQERTGAKVFLEGRALLNLSSNDYLGLAGDKNLAKQFYSGLQREDFLKTFALGSTSSRLLAGENEVSRQLEAEIARAYGGGMGALLFNSGYHANVGVLPSLYGKKDLILSDKLNHASIVDGTRLSLAEVKRYNHLDYEHLRWLLKKNRDEARRVVIVSESVFSMDGDVADLEKLIDLKKEFGTAFYLDEGHAVGLYGKTGLGKAEEAGVLAEVDYLVGLFGKALASQGAFVVCAEEIRSYLINSARSLIFTTAPPPVVTSWNLFIFRQLVSFEKKRTALRNLATRLREELRNYDLRTDGETNIIPVIIGEDTATVRLAEKMREEGFFVLPIRPPTVPAGTSRFRLSLTAEMVWEDLEGLPKRIAEECEKNRKNAAL